ncbi:MAG: hypothetical protein KAI66_00105 [Lentisphaeria bacterium]|nr:hypothetical protein [Lentisphaeria bacterium]
MIPITRAVATSLFCCIPLVGSLFAADAERRARVQPTVPDTYKEVPFAETAEAPTLTASERARGFLLFQRPIMDPVYPNTRPLSRERLQTLTAFATPGEFEPLTFSIYPTRALENLRVEVSALTGGASEIPASALDVRLLTYWNIGYPRYTSRTTYRRTPELLERVTVHSSPAEECQRWWITVRVPDGAKPGVYRGMVRVQDDQTAAPVTIPVAFRVLGFRLQSDPAKHYSVYYNLKNRVQFKGRDKAFVQRAIGNEYKAMVDLGIDACPTLYLRVDREKDKLYISHMEEFERMLAAGLRGPIPLAGGNAIGAIYTAMTPGGKRGSHWRISKMPPPEFYTKVTEMFRALEAERKAKGWPELVCCPLDEVDSSRKEFGAGVYKAVRKAGIRTYITKNPVALDAADYEDGIDVWCSQPYSMPYEKIVGQTRYDYWSYPNHNAGEIKDRRVMCKGGRMTYGFGFWRSGYSTLIPWHWAWTPGDDQFDYLRARRSGCGQRIDDDGEVIPAVYWQCFREGRDDARTIYTLQQAVWEREGTKNRACGKLVAEGKALLQSMWDDIKVQEKYLATDMWPSAEFNARRWRLALATEMLLRHPAVRTGVAPSVLVGKTNLPASDTDENFIDKAIAQGRLDTMDLGGDFTEWVNVTGEGKLSITPEAGKDGKLGLRWQVKVDHKTDGGGEAGKYPIGWPRTHRSFSDPALDMASYDYLMFVMRIDSDRDEVADDVTSVGFTIHSNKFYEVSRDLGGRQRVWLPVLFPVRSLIDAVGQGDEPWRAIGKVQFFIGESNYAHGTNLTFDVAEVKLLRFKAPMIRAVDVPASLLLPQSRLAVNLTLMGKRPDTRGTFVTKMVLLDEKGRSRVEKTQDLVDGDTLLLDTSGIKPGSYRLRVAVQAVGGAVQSQAECAIECVPGPFWQD